MAVVGWEIILVGIIVLVLFIWGPQKIPEMARSIGRARREFEEASKNITQPISPPVIENAATDSLTDVAHKLGIRTLGKTEREISDEIVRLTRQTRTAPLSSP